MSKKPQFAYEWHLSKEEFEKLEKESVKRIIEILTKAYKELRERNK